MFADAGIRLPKVDLRDTRLVNGLRVILVPDHSVPVYAINLSYNVGSRNELPGHTGFAHLFEVAEESDRPGTVSRSRPNALA